MSMFVLSILVLHVSAVEVGLSCFDTPRPRSAISSMQAIVQINRSRDSPVGHSFAPGATFSRLVVAWKENSCTVRKDIYMYTNLI